MSEKSVPEPKVLTVEMVKKRSEHNDGILRTLEEVAMHQDEIGVITNVFERFTPHLKILYLQNNYIEKMQHFNGLKELEYLNLALNNISVIEGVDKCESLKKLDLTCNFIVDIICVQVLEENEELRELYLVGNPCDKFTGYRDFVIATLPQLQILDGKEILPSERISAKRRLKQLTESMLQQAATADTSRFTPEDRLAAWREIEEKKMENTPPPPSNQFTAEAYKPKPPPRGPDASGKIVQSNMGKWTFKWYGEDDKMCLDVNINRYLDTSLIDIEVNPTWIRIEAKGKVLQLVLPAEVYCEDVEALRSQTTGHLVVKMKMVEPNPYLFASK